MLQIGIISMLHVMLTHVWDYKRQKCLLPTFLRRLSKKEKKKKKKKVENMAYLVYTNK